jgi:methylphosphotriester-DNA--protein-cysteine methyltransferase
MHLHSDLADSELGHLVRKKKIRMAGHLRLRIYGTLGCKSGKRMKRINRVFFANEREAKALGFRPCGRCLRVEYLKWKENNRPQTTDN